MNNDEFVTLQVADGTEMDAYIAFPTGDGSFPGIIVLQEAFGVNNHIRNIGERLCSQGYAVIAPDLFHRTAKRVEISYTDFPAAAPHMKAISTEGLEADLKASYEWLQQQPSVLREKIASIGFCLGGRVSFIANTILPLAAAVSYYGGGMDALAARVADMHAAHLFFWGGKDTHIPQEKIDAIINAVKATGKDYVNTVISYADYGFNCDERSSYNAAAAKEAWAATLAFLENRLKVG